MTKQELLKIMRLLSAMEAIRLMQASQIPEFISAEVIDCVEILEREILK